MTEPQATERQRDPADVVEIKARNQQELARIANEHELELARLDAQAMRKMPLPLRMIFDDRLRAKIEQAAKDMSEARGFTPPHLLGKTAACKVVIVKAIGWNLDHYAVAAATYETPGGKVGFEGSLYRAIAAESGLIVGEFEYEWYGEWDRIPRPSFKMARNENGKMVPTPLWEYWGAAEKGLGIRVTATIAATGKERSIDFDLIDAHPRNATTWPTRPRLQIINPATRAFVTLVKPELLMGVHFRDAVPDDAPEMRDVTPEPAAEPEPQAQRSKLSVIADLNPPAEGGGGSVPNTSVMVRGGGVSREPIPQTAPGRGMPLGTNQQVTVPPQDAGYSEAPHQSAWHALAEELAAAPAPESPESAPPPETAPTGQQSASKVASSAELVKMARRAPSAAADALIEIIQTSSEPGKAIDYFAPVLDALLDEHLVNKVLAAAEARGNKDEQKHADAERERQASAKVQEALHTGKRGRPLGSKNKPKERPPEPAGGDRSQEPAATPAPGRHEPGPASGVVLPEWVIEDEMESRTEPATYYLTDTRGDVSATNLTAAAFLGLLESSIGMATSQEAKAWKARNSAALEHLILNERDEALAERAVKLQA